MSYDTDCPVCEALLKRKADTSNVSEWFYSCPHCGDYCLVSPTDVLLRKHLVGDTNKAGIFAHMLRRMQVGTDWPRVTWEVAKQIMEKAELPSPHEQADNLLRWLGSNSPGPGEYAVVTFAEHGAIVGAKSIAGFVFIAGGLKEAGLIDAQLGAEGTAHATLSFRGWARYEELRSGAPSGRIAFMAMKFGDSILDALVDTHFRPAVNATNFTLRKLDDVPKAGLIDDRLRVEIQSCRFLIADLTHANNGAYWEAGYAEGLGKPVIYTCEKSVFTKASHFDTNHHLTVLWEVGGEAMAAAKLADTIRATIPEAARGTLTAL